MPFPSLSAIVSMVFCIFVVAQTARADSCLSSSASASVEGMVTIRANDADAKPYILMLSNSVCLRAEDALDNVDSAREIHIFSSSSAVHSSIGRFVGRHVIIRGRAFPAHTRYHHAAIVMDVEQID